MARPIRKGLSYYPMDVDFFDDEKIFALMDTYGPLGSVVYENVLSMVYRQGYYLEISTDALAAQITRRIGSRWVRSIGHVREIIECCTRLGLLDAGLMSRGVVTSRGIQRRYAQVTVRRKHRGSEHWLLGEEDNASLTAENAEETTEPVSENEVYVCSGYTNKTKLNQTKQKESKVNESKAKQTEPECPSDDGCDVLKSSAARAFENAVRPLTGAELLRLDNLSMIYGKYRVLAAVTEAVMRGGKSVGYVEAILRRTYDTAPGEAPAPESVTSDRCRELEELMEEGAYTEAQ